MIWSIIIMIVIAAGLLLGIQRQKRGNTTSRDQQNIKILRQQLADLKLQHAAGEIKDEAYQQAHDELAVTLQNDLNGSEQQAATVEEKGLFTQRNTIIVVLLFIGILTPLIYYELGTPSAIDMATAPTRDDPHQSTGQKNIASVEDMVARLEQKLQGQPGNAEGWFTLGRTYMVMRKYNKAVTALHKAFELNASDPDVLVSYADALAMQKGTGITGKSFTLVRQALELDPNNKIALWLTAMGYEAKNDYKTALLHWQKLLPLMQDTPAEYSEVEKRLSNASMKSGITIKMPKAKKASGATGITVIITLDKKYKSKLKGSELVFVFARAAHGPRQPLAAKRLRVSDLPATVELDDSMAMSPGNKLSDHNQVYIGARISRSGNPIASSGDIQGRSKVLETSKLKGPVNVVISQEIL